MSPTLQRILILSDGRPGHQSQSEGVAHALGSPQPEIITLRPRVNLRFWGWLPVSWCFSNLASIPTADVTIGTGYQVSRALRWLRRTRGQFIVAIQRPSGALSDYHVVALPAHDVQGHTAPPPNIVTTVGAPNTITPALLAQEDDRWRQRFRHLPQPRLAVLIGGPSRHGPLSVADVTGLLTAALSWAQHSGGSLLITTSRRTGPLLTEALQRRLATTPVPHLLYQPGGVDNPYHAMLATAHAVLATLDSVSMVSQAASAGRMVYGWGNLAAIPPKFARFYALLQQQHRWAQWPASNNPAVRTPRQPLRDAALVAGFIHSMWLRHPSGQRRVS